MRWCWITWGTLVLVACRPSAPILLCAAHVQKWVDECLVNAEPATLSGFDLESIASNASASVEDARTYLSHACILSSKGRASADRVYSISLTPCRGGYLVCASAAKGFPITHAFYCDGESIIREKFLERSGQNNEDISLSPNDCQACAWP